MLNGDRLDFLGVPGVEGDMSLELRFDLAGVLIREPIGSPLIHIERLLFPSTTLGYSVNRLLLLDMNS